MINSIINPFNDFTRMFDLLDNAFRYGNRCRCTEGKCEDAKVVPTYYKNADETSMTLEVELPGVKKEAISAEFEPSNRVLAIAAKRTANGKEFEYTMAVHIPEGFETDKAATSYEDGLLVIKVPKSKTDEPRKLTIS